MIESDQVPITGAECDAAFECLLAFDHILLAVSGGPDSLAMLVLAADWLARRRQRYPALSVATVDHGLRSGSAAEADKVAHEARTLGLEHATLAWTSVKPSTGVAAAAREARYHLLDEHARAIAECERVAVATAHHRDDQAETFAMRLARGAGVDGLAAMPRQRAITPGSRVVLVRPLLDFSKARLVATLEARGAGFIEDPTNADLRYERPRTRLAIKALNEANISSKALATSARRAADAKDALRYAEDAFVSSLNLSFGHEVFASFERKAFDAAPVYLRQKLLDRLLKRYGGASPPPELAEIEALAARLAKSATSRATLGGSVISAGPRSVRIWREPGRLDVAETPITAGTEHIWDRRFVVRLVPATCRSVSVRPLGADAYATISDRIDRRRMPPARAVHALPSFWAGSELLAIPALAPFAKSGGLAFTHDEIDVQPLAGRP